MLLEFMVPKRLNFLKKLCRGFSVFLLTLCLMPGAATVFANDGETAEYNRRATATAQILAGITPNPPDPALKRLVESEAFKEHQQWMSSSWNQVRHRIQTMEAWRSHEIKIPATKKKNLLYPFSGPDRKRVVVGKEGR